MSFWTWLGGHDKEVVPEIRCVDCAYHGSDFETAMLFCNHPSVRQQLPSGEYELPQWCRAARRRDGVCGTEAKYFKPSEKGM